MKFISFIFLLFSVKNFAMVDQGEILSSKKYNESTLSVGTIQQSLLTESQFQSIQGSCWVKMRGQCIASSCGSSDSDLFSITGQANLPNTEGRFLRDSGGNAAALGQSQGDAIQNITGFFRFLSSVDFDWNASGAFSVVSEENRDFTGAVSDTRSGARVEFDASNQVPTANENRPVNITVNYFIKIDHECD